MSARKPAKTLAASVRKPAETRAGSARSTQRRATPSKAVRGRAVTASQKDEDGRRLRAARNYESVVSAVLEIARECPPNVIYLPSAAEVAARAGVSERTVFRHFADLNALFVAAASRIRPIQDAYVGPRPDAPHVADRIDEIVRLRSKLFEEIAPVRRVAIHLSHTHPLLVEQLGQAYAAARAQVADVFAPELSRVDSRRRQLLLDALDVRGELGVVGLPAHGSGLLCSPCQADHDRAADRPSRNRAEAQAPLAHPTSCRLAQGGAERAMFDKYLRFVCPRTGEVR